MKVLAERRLLIEPELIKPHRPSMRFTPQPWTIQANLTEGGGFVFPNMPGCDPRADQISTCC